MSDFIYPNDQPVVLLDCSAAFNALTETEKLYAHYLSRAAWYGGLIVLFQTSPESPLIYVLLEKLFRAESVSKLKEKAVSICGFTEDEFTAFLVYTCGILSNMGNYKGFGDSKFIPNLPKDKFEKLVLESKAAELYPQEMKRFLGHCLDKMYSLESNETHLGFPDVGATTYFSKNFTKEDNEVVKNFMKEEKIDGYNTRCFKICDKDKASNESVYVVKFASVLSSDDPDDLDDPTPFKKRLVKSENHCFELSRGDYGKLLGFVNKCLSDARKYVSKPIEAEMLDAYIASFRTGHLQYHKDGSRCWIKNIGPVVETYLGFIETYRDPAGVRGEFEGFVAMVNKPMSKKFTDLVEHAEEFLPLLPWPKTYEKDQFLRPDFTSLDVLTFAGSGIPAGICIPNYDEIRQNEGFKNVSLGNVIHASIKGSKANFVTKSDQVLLDKYRLRSFEVAVGLHELLGHGSGKLFKKEKDAFNFDCKDVLHLETGEKLTSWYEDGENYDSVFGSFGSSYEECRAECVALYLSTEPKILKVFGYEGIEADDMMYVLWYDMCHKGIEALQMYDPSTKSWLQAHSQARYVILQVCLEAGEGFIKIEETTGEDGKPDLVYTMDKNKILTVGKEAIGNFLKKLQLYRATADSKTAAAMYGALSEVSEKGKYPFLNYKEIVMARKKPRKMFVQGNTFIEGDKVVLRSYESTHEGLIQSWIDRFDPEDKLDDILEEIWQSDMGFFS